MLEHCNRTFRADEIWFLDSNQNFTHRKLEIGFCPDCYKTIAKLTEKRVIDGQVFQSIATQRKADKLINNCRNEIQYTSLDSCKIKGSPFGFIYGENQEKVNKKTGEVVRIEKACDFFGNKKIITKKSL